MSRSPRRGCLLTVTSNLPVGAGLSSSAAFLGALHLALGGDGDLVQTAHVLAQAEAASGTPVGLLDQLATLGANAQSALLIDFANLTLRDVPISDVVGLSIVHTETERELATSAYVERRAQCATLDSLLGEWSRRPDAWRDVDDDLLRRRARHVCTDNTRVERAADALTRGDLVGLGVLLNESHESLRDDFEVSTPEVDEVWRSVNLLPGVAGSRLMGGGFGGCLLVAHEPELDLALAHHRTWPVRASAGAFARLGRPR